jgi:predicted ATPase/DNA-binding SARP family transcriptional activator/Tfp pilus assembly protein PilF
MRFGVLGPLAVWTNAGEPLTVPGLKVRALLADLLVHGGQPVSVDRLVDDLWGERPPADAAGALQAKISQLRRALACGEPDGRELVKYQPPGYLLRAADDAVDARQFQNLVRRARATEDPGMRAAVLADALKLWRGHAFADFGDQLFTQASITRLEEERLAALEEQAEARLQLGEHAQLAGELTGLVARYPLRERLRAAQLRALYRAGRPGDALSSYRELRERLTEELGLEPSPELAALQHAILTQDPSLQAPAQPAPKTVLRTNLPSPVDDLIGRTEAVAQVRALLASGRLVTLTGPGGVGKTRLAVETAAAAAAAFPDGTWLVELAVTGRPDSPADDTPSPLPVTEADVAELVAAALGIRDDTPGGPLADRLAAALQTRQTLLVLDNCEHLIGPVAGLAERLLWMAPGLRVLATSQDPLAIRGEQLYETSPLELPDPAASPALAAGAKSPAVQLFVARTTAVVPGFTLDASNSDAVADICRRLDGIPLALELAAAQVRALGVHALAARLDDRFRLLARGKRGAPARQQTLRAVVDWSWELATEAEHAVLRRLAVHADGCTLAAAEEVCAGPDTERADIAGLLTRLVDRSLVVVTDRAGEPRYRLLESVAAYCAERLGEAAELDRVQRRHREFYTILAEQARPQLRGHDQQQWLDRLDRETANFHLALDGAIRHREAQLALRLAGAMTWFWFLRGRLTEARRALEAALAVDGDAPAPVRAFAAAWQAGITLLAGAAGDPAKAVGTVLELYHGVEDPRGQAEAEWFLGFAASDFGDLPLSEELVSRARDRFCALGDRWGIAAALSTQAKQAAARGDLAAVTDNGQQSLTLFRELGDAWGQLQATEWLGTPCETSGDYEQARRLHADGLRMAEELGLWPQAADRLSWLGRAAMLSGDHAQARQYLEQAIRLAAGQCYKPGEVFAEINLGTLARREGKLDIAETHLRKVLTWHRQMGYAPDVAKSMVLTELGFAAEQRGDPEAAQAFHLDGLAIARELGDPRAVAVALEGLAGAQVLAGHHECAARLLGTAAATRDAAQTPLPLAERGDVDRLTTTVRAALGNDQFDAQLRNGAAMTLEEARAAIVPLG